MKFFLQRIRSGVLLIAFGCFGVTWALEIRAEQSDVAALIDIQSTALKNTFPLENMALIAQAEPRSEITDIVLGAGSGDAHRVDQVTVESVAAGPRTPATAEERNWLDVAIQEVKRRDFATASTNLVVMLQLNPHSAIADEAWYWLGEARYLDRSFAEALTVSNTLIQYFPKSDYVPAVQLRIGLILYEMKEYAASRDMISALIADSPKDAIARRAGALLEDLKVAGF